MQARTQRSVYQLLGAYRTFAIAAAALQMALVTLPDFTRLLDYLILGGLALYSLVRVLLPFHRRFRDGYPGLVVDVVVCTLPLFLAGGLASPFLFYSLCPIIYAALIFPKRAALGCATFSSLGLVASLFFPNPSQVNVSFAGTYVIACFLVAMMAYTTNISVYRRLEQDAALNERKKLARELHDTVAQTLAYVNLKASLVIETLAKGNLRRSFRELEQMKQTLDDTYEDVRRAINALGRPSPEAVDFVSALSRQVKDFSQNSDLKSHLSVPENELKLSPPAVDELLRIVGEAMVNARNHAHASNVQVRVSGDEDWVKVSIKDDGRGFEPSAYYGSQKVQDHHGIAMMKERAELLGGKLEITSTPGSGTVVKATIPLE